MILSNLNNLTLIIFLILLIVGLFLLWKIYKKENNYMYIVLLFLSYIFIIINIFEIKGGYNNKIENIEGGKIVFILDVSKSINAIDIKTKRRLTSRLEASKILINTYMSENLTNSYGLIIFAGEALEIIPFTTDFGLFKTILYGITNSNIGKYGTNITSVFNSLHNYFGENDEGGLAVIFTDGGDGDLDLSNDLYNSIKKKGINILIVGLGTKEGAKIPDGLDIFNRYVYKRYKGKEVITKINDKGLKKLSSKFDIKYISIDNINDNEYFSKYITNNINLVTLEKNINYRLDYTRALIFISFSFFTLYLFFTNFLGRRK